MHDLETIKATSLEYGQGTLTLFDGKTLVDTLHFGGSLTSANFGLASDGHGGTDIVFETSTYRAASSISQLLATREGGLGAGVGYGLVGHAHLPV